MCQKHSDWSSQLSNNSENTQGIIFFLIGRKMITICKNRFCECLPWVLPNRFSDEKKLCLTIVSTPRVGTGPPLTFVEGWALWFRYELLVHYCMKLTPTPHHTAASPPTFRSLREILHDCSGWSFARRGDFHNYPDTTHYYCGWNRIESRRRHFLTGSHRTHTVMDA